MQLLQYNQVSLRCCQPYPSHLVLHNDLLLWKNLHKTYSTIIGALDGYQRIGTLYLLLQRDFVPVQTHKIHHS